MDQVRTAISVLGEAAAARAPIAFDALRHAMSASYCLMFAECGSERQVEAPVLEGVHRGYGERLQLAAEEHLLPAWLRRLDEGAVIDRAALQQDNEFIRSNFYNYVIRPEGRFHCLIGTPYVTPTRRYHLIVGRPARHAEFTHAEVSTLRALLPYVANIIALANDAARASDQSSGLMAAFDCLSDNVAVVSGSGELVFANAGARRLLALGNGLGLAGRKLRGLHPAATASLLNAVAQVTADQGPEDVVVCLPRAFHSAPYQVTARRIDPAPCWDVSGRRALLLIQHQDRPPQLDGAFLVRNHGLTGREAEVALLLCQGIDLRSVAAALGVSYETARSHLRGAFNKMDVHRQSDLVRMVLNGAPRAR